MGTYLSHNIMPFGGLHHTQHRLYICSPVTLNALAGAVSLLDSASVPTAASTSALTSASADGFAAQTAAWTVAAGL